MNKYAKVDYSAIEKLQKEALDRAKSSQKRFSKFKEKTQKINHFYSRHRMNWADSYEKLISAETQTELNIEYQTKSLFLFHEKTFKTPSHTLPEVFKEIQNCDVDIENLR
jgi:hypothetical protein